MKKGEFLLVITFFVACLFLVFFVSAETNISTENATNFTLNISSFQVNESDLGYGLENITNVSDILNDSFEINNSDVLDVVNDSNKNITIIENISLDENLTEDDNFNQSLFGMIVDFFEETFNALAVIVQNQSSVSTAFSSYNLNATSEPSGNSHLTNSITAPYDSLVAYYSFDRDFPDYAWGNGSQGKIGNALKFDGTNDWVSRPYVAVYPLLANKNFTVSLWSNTINYASGNQYFFQYGMAANRNAFGLRFTSGALRFEIYNDTAGQTTFITLNASYANTNNVWTNYGITWDGYANTTCLYVNGVQSNCTTTTFAGINYVMSIMGIGSNAGGSAAPFNGYIDDFAMWNRTLTAEELSEIYSRGAQGLPQNLTDEYLFYYYPFNETNGSIVYDISGKGNTGELIYFGQATDLTGNNNDGTLTNAGAKINNTGFGGLYDDYIILDGSNDYVNLGASNPVTSGNYSYSFWMKANISSSGAMIEELGGNYYSLVQTSASKAYIGIRNTSATVTYSAIGTSSIVNNKWHYITATKSENSTSYLLSIYVDGVLEGTGSGLISAFGSFTPTTRYIGTHAAATYYNGSIDEVMVFNTTLTAQQILDIYNNQSVRFYNSGTTEMQNININQTGQNTVNAIVPFESKFGSNVSMRIGSWNISYGYNNSAMDGLVAYYRADGDAKDVLGVYNGTLTNGAVANESGQFNSSFNFDGINDYVNITIINPLVSRSNYTYSMWFKDISSDAAQHYLMARAESSGKNGTGVYVNTNGVLCLLGNETVGGSATFSNTAIKGDKKWHHVACSYNGATLTTYVDGVAGGVYTGVTNGPYFNPTIALSIGYVTSTAYWNGSIDEVMIFNRSLTALEIAELSTRGRALWQYSNSYQTLTDYFNYGSGYSLSNLSFRLPENTTNILPSFRYDSTPTTNFYTTYIGGAGNYFFYNTSSMQYDTSLPVMNYESPTPLNGSAGSSGSLIINVSASDENLVNVTIYFFNSSGSVLYSNSSSTSPLTLEISGLGEGTYYYNATSQDILNPSSWLDNRTYIVDTTKPLISLVDPTPFNYQNLSSNDFVLNVSITEMHFDSLIFSLDDVNYSGGCYSSDNISYSCYRAFENISEGSHNFSVWMNDSASNSNITEIRNISIDVTVPAISAIGYSPNDTDGLDPNVNLTFSVNVTDNIAGVDRVFLNFYNGSEWRNLSMAGNANIYALNLTLGSAESVYNFSIIANDTYGNVMFGNYSDFNSSWDCTWDISTTSIDAVAGFYEDKYIGNVTLINTGDSQYAINGCGIRFNSNYNGFSSSYYSLSNWPSTDRALKFNSTVIVYPKTNYTLLINASFPSIENPLQENPVITVNASIRDSIDRFTNRTVNSTIIISPPGPYLYTEISEANSVVYLTPGNITLNAYAKNLAGDGSLYNTAYNVNITWDLPDNILTGIEGNVSIMFENLSDNVANYNTLNIPLTSSNLNEYSPGSFSFSVSTFGYSNTSGNLSIITHANNQTILNDSATIIFLCYNESDGIYVSSCGSLDGDYTAPSVDSGDSGGSGGGGGGGSGGVSSKYEQSSARFEIVRGQDQSFNFEIKNKYNFPFEDITIKASGINSEYLSISPVSIYRLDVGQSTNISVSISAPSYFGQKNYTLYFDIEGFLRAENTTPVAIHQRKTATLIILEISNEEASNMSEYIDSVFERMNSSGLYVVELSKLKENADSAFNSKDYASLKSLYEQIRAIDLDSKEAQKIMDELNNGISSAESNGIAVEQTKKLLYFAETAFKRGDYKLALERLREAKLAYALEVKGEFSVYYAVKNNPVQSLMAVIGLGFVYLGSSFAIRRKVYKNKLKALAEEEKIILELMKVVQRECFEKGTMSMEEYEESMRQYEIKLSETIKSRINMETKLANLMRVKGNKKALIDEKKRLSELIKKVQGDYLQKGTLETRVYENMLRSYSGRLSEVEEHLTFLDAEEALSSHRFWNKILKLVRIK